MDPVRNPYAPGAGSPPPALAGREEILEEVRILLERARIGRASRHIVMVGLRGVGKTVLLERIRENAEAAGIYTLQMEVSENRSLPAVLAPQLRLALRKLSARTSARQAAERALRVLAGFVRALKLKYGDIEVGLDFDPEPGLADNGDLEADLQDLLEVVGEAARADGSCVAILIDELQYVDKDQIAALITALHRTTQRRLPVAMVGAGLPQVRGGMGEARTYAERLFDFPEIGILSPADARFAIAEPALNERVEIKAPALDAIVDQTQGYPYFLQAWGKQVWDLAERSPITPDDVEVAGRQAIVGLDESFFRVRFDRLTPAERGYLRAMAQLGPGPHRSGDIARELGRAVNALSPRRAQLIKKGMIWSPGHGDTAFTVPMFDQFMRRIMPGDAWRHEG